MTLEEARAELRELLADLAQLKPFADPLASTETGMRLARAWTVARNRAGLIAEKYADALEAQGGP